MLLECATTDWLNTKPVFYNEKTGAISHNMTEVIDYSNFEFSPEGLRNYLKFGYTVYGQTMVNNVKCLDWCSQITKKPDGSIEVSKSGDIALSLWNPGRVNGTEVFDNLVECTREWAMNRDEESDIVLPLSGGLDSRILAYSLKNMKNAKAFSYGLSADQSISFEVVKAEQVAKSCNIEWNRIELNEYLKQGYIDEWYDIYGPAIHLHGMYQLEFFKKIKEKNAHKKLGMLSGIVGDVWAGNVRVPAINNPGDLAYLGYTHGISVEDDVCLLKESNDARNAFFEAHSVELREESFRVLYTIRLKMMLLRYLLRTPEYLGMDAWSPFMVPDIAMSILNLDWSLKTDRVWQHKELDKLDLDLGWKKKECDYNIVIDIETLRKNPVRPLDVELLSSVIKREYVEYINSTIRKKPIRILPAKPKTVSNVYNKAIRRYNSDIEKALISYEILGSIEKLMLDVKKYNS